MNTYPHSVWGIIFFLHEASCYQFLLELTHMLGWKYHGLKGTLLVWYLTLLLVFFLLLDCSELSRKIVFLIWSTWFPLLSYIWEEKQSDPNKIANLWLLSSSLFWHGAPPLSYVVVAAVVFKNSFGWTGLPCSTIVYRDSGS